MTPAPGAAGGDPRRGLLDGPRRPVLRDAARRPRRRRGQGGAARGRPDPRLGAAVGRRRGRRDADRRLLPRGQPQQALDRARPQAPTRAARSCGGCSRRRDVLVENFSASAGSSGWGSATTSSRRSTRTSSTSRSPGSGPTGPDAAKPGYDFVVQAVGGLMSITGDPDAEGGGPTKVGVAISDVVTGLFGAVSRAGRARRARAGRRAGGAGGQRIDVSLLGVDARRAGQPGAERLRRRGGARAARQRPPEHRPVRGVRDGRRRLALAVGSERQWPRLCEALGLPELAADPRFATNGDRVDNRAALRPILAARFLDPPDGGVARGARRGRDPVRADQRRRAAFASPQAQAPAMTVDVEHRSSARSARSGIPFALSATPASIRTPPPLLGEHTGEVLAELGYDEARSPRWRGGRHVSRRDDHLPDEPPARRHRRPGEDAPVAVQALLAAGAGRRRRPPGRRGGPGPAGRLGSPPVRSRASCALPVHVHGPDAGLPRVRAGAARRAARRARLGPSGAAADLDRHGATSCYSAGMTEEVSIWRGEEPPIPDCSGRLGSPRNAASGRGPWPFGAVTFVGPCPLLGPSPHAGIRHREWTQASGDRATERMDCQSQARLADASGGRRWSSAAAGLDEVRLR